VDSLLAGAVLGEVLCVPRSSARPLHAVAASVTNRANRKSARIEMSLPLMPVKAPATAISA